MTGAGGCLTLMPRCSVSDLVSDGAPWGFRRRTSKYRTDIPKARLSRYENGRVVPSLQTLIKLADRLDVSLDALTAGLFRKYRVRGRRVKPGDLFRQGADGPPNALCEPVTSFAILARPPMAA